MKYLKRCTMSSTYKAVFTCEALSERVVWYVSSRNEAERHVYRHINTHTGKRLEKYKRNAWELKVTPMFRDDLEVTYEVVGSWGN